MTTIDEFNKIIQSMYDKGYVMVSPHDMAVINEEDVYKRQVTLRELFYEKYKEDKILRLPIVKIRNGSLEVEV